MKRHQDIININTGIMEFGINLAGREAVTKKQKIFLC